MSPTSRTLIKATSKGALIGAALSIAALGIAHYGWNTVAQGRAPFWVANHHNRIPGQPRCRQTRRPGRQ